MVAIGTVITTTDSPNLEKIVIILNTRENSRIVERGQFISVPKNEKLIVLGLIRGIKKYNAYYETLDSSVQELASRDYEAIFPVEEWETTLVELQPLGEVNLVSKRINRLKYPVSPGSKAYIASTSIVSQFLGLDSNGIHWGVLQSNDVEIKINLSRLLRKHLAIMAISGAGKSYATSILLEEIHKKRTLGVLVIDPHGEYSKILPATSKDNKIKVIKGSFISIGVPELSAWDFAELIPEMSVVQTRVLEGIIEIIQKKNEFNYGLSEIIHLLSSSESINNRTKEALIGWLYSLQRTYLFSNETNPKISKLIEPGTIVIFDLADITNVRSRSIIVHFYLKHLYYQRIHNKIPPSLLVIEEAHQFCPQTHRSISKRIIETIAREGRKFYTCLCLISQRPVNLSVTALSQCNTNLILRIRNPYDLDFIGKTSEGIDRITLKIIPDLEIGEALLVGEGINHPIFFRIRSRDNDIEEQSLNLENMAKNYVKLFYNRLDPLKESKANNLIN